MNLIPLRCNVWLNLLLLTTVRTQSVTNQASGSDLPQESLLNASNSYTTSTTSAPTATIGTDELPAEVTTRARLKVVKVVQKDRDSKNSSDGDEKRLNDYLKIEPAVRPVRNASSTVVVRVGLTLIQVIDMHEKDQILTTNVWIDQMWQDEFIKWNPDEFGGIKVFRIPSKRIWRPDLVLYNNAADYIEERMNPRAMVDSNGSVFWPLPTKMKSSCKVDVTYFPFDSQICRFRFGSWTYDGLQVDIQNKSTGIELIDYVPNGEWDLIHALSYRKVRYYPCCTEPYPDVNFEIHIKRRTLYYAYHIIYPCIVMSVLTLLVFRLPSESGEKVGLGVTVLLAYSVLTLSVAEVLPETSESVPVISIYLMVIMGLSALSVIFTVLILSIYHCGTDTPPLPRYLKMLIRRDLEKLDTDRSKVRKLSEHLRLGSKAARLTDRLVRRLSRADHNDCREQNGCLATDSCVSRKNGEAPSGSATQSDTHMHMHTKLRPTSSWHRKLKLTTCGTLAPIEHVRRVEFQDVEHSVTAQKRIPRVFKHGAKAGTCFVNNPTEGSPVFRQSRPSIVASVSPQCVYKGSIVRCSSVDSLPTVYGKLDPCDTHERSESVRIAALLENVMQKGAEEEAVSRIRREWQTLARLIDRTLFWIFLLLTLLFTATLLVIIPLFTKFD